MSASKIEWTERTWNPIVGCSIVSPGCTNCYAMRMASRIEAMSEKLYDGGKICPPGHYAGTTKKVNGNPVWTGKLARAPDDTLLQPLRRKKPTIYFVNSMGDLFHEDCPDEWIDRVFTVMALCPQHTFQVLTKRAERMRSYVSDGGCDLPDRSAGDGPRMSTSERVMLAAGVRELLLRIDKWRWPLPNVWLGVSCERQQEADERIPLLLQTPAAVRFISAEPLLGPISLSRWIHEIPPDAIDRSGGHKGGLFSRIDWLICGGESGPHARPMHPDWARSLRDQCQAAGVAFFFKQFGEWAPTSVTLWCIDREQVNVLPDGRREWQSDFPTSRLIDSSMRIMARVGKKAAGRLLDGREHNDMPVPR